jgi:methyl-accepting chemotaxis protein
MDENARRLATVATQGFSSEWLTQLSEQFGEQDFFQPIMAAMQGGDEGALKQAANDILANNVSALWDVGVVVQQVKQKLQEQQAAQRFQQAVKEALQTEGIDTSLDIVATAVGDTTQATDQVQTSLNQVGEKAGSAFGNVGESAENARAGIQGLESDLNKILKILGGISAKADEAQKNIKSLGGATGVGGDGGASPPKTGAPADL